MSLLGIMKQKTLTPKVTPLEDGLNPMPKPGLLKRKPAFKPSDSTEVQPSLMKRLTGK